MRYHELVRLNCFQTTAGSLVERYDKICSFSNILQAFIMATTRRHQKIAHTLLAFVPFSDWIIAVF